jgi:fluoride ion exporter CrcB/FEX
MLHAMDLKPATPWWITLLAFLLGAIVGAVLGYVICLKLLERSAFFDPSQRTLTCTIIASLCTAIFFAVWSRRPLDHD